MMRAFGSYLNNSNGFENINEIEWINEIPRVDSVQNIYIPMGAHELLQCSVSNMSCLPPKALFKNNFGNSKSRNPWYISDNPYIQNPWRLVRRYSYKNHCRSRLIRARRRWHAVALRGRGVTRRGRRRVGWRTCARSIDSQKDPFVRFSQRPSGHDEPGLLPGKAGFLS